MSKTQEIKEVLEKAKAEGCVRFPESKGYRGPGLSVFERMQEWLERSGAKDANGQTPKLTKTSLKQLLLTDEFKSMRFTGNIAGDKKAKTSRAGFNLLGFISGDGEEGSAVAPAETSQPASNAATSAPVQEAVMANDDDDIFG